MNDLIDAHVTHMRALGLSDNTREDRWRILVTADRQLPHGLDHANRREIEAFLANPRWGANTRCTHFSHLAEFYRWAADADSPELTLNPMAGMRRPKPPKATPNPASEEQIGHALANSPPWWQLVITLAAYGGLRVADICRLRREDVTPERILIRAGKGDRTATVPTHPQIWRLVGPRPPGLLVPGVGGRALRPGRMSAMARRHFDALGLPQVHLHMLRHRFATMLLRGGADIRVVQELMRHSSLQTTAGYLAITDGQRRDAITALPTCASPLQSAA